MFRKICGGGIIAYILSEGIKYFCTYKKDDIVANPKHSRIENIANATSSVLRKKGMAGALGIAVGLCCIFDK